MPREKCPSRYRFPVFKAICELERATSEQICAHIQMQSGLVQQALRSLFRTRCVTRVAVHDGRHGRARPFVYSIANPMRRA